MLSLRIAARFLRTSPAQSLLIAAGIAVGIGVQVFLGSLIISLQDSLVDETVGGSSQVTVQAREEGGAVTYGRELQRTLTEQEGVTTRVPVRTFSGILRLGGESAPLQLTAGELEELDTIYDLTASVVSGTASLGEYDILVGKDLADEYGLEPGDRVTLIEPSGREVSEEVAAVVDLGARAANLGSGFVSADLGQAVLGMQPDEYSAIQMQVDDVFASAEIADQLAAQPALSGLEVTEWQTQNQDLLDALQSQSSSSYTIQFFVLVAVALGIASTLAISAVQKTRQIGILKAMGMKDRQTGRIFLWEAALLGLAGATAGIGVGIGLIYLFSVAGASFSIDPQWSFVAISWAIGVLVALGSSLIPARRTRRLDPIEVIQNG